MRIIDILKKDGIHLSFEIFPPRNEGRKESVMQAVRELVALSPDFISVTYGAGGGTSSQTGDIATEISNLGCSSLAHLTCVSSTKEEVKEVIQQLKAKKIENILALRGDLPKDGNLEETHYRYAYELIQDIRKEGEFCIGAACYPEGHIESPHKEDDILYLKQKVETGVDFLTTQMFFDNHSLYNFLYRIREKGIEVPVVAGIMPVIHAKQIQRICSLSGATLPPKFSAILDRFGNHPEAMKQAGISYATDQIIDLFANGVQNIHIYTMNKPEIGRAILENISEIVKV